MKKAILLFGLLLMVTVVKSQKLHSTFEILQLMVDSKLRYEIKILDKPVLCKDYSEKLNRHDCYRVSTDSSIETIAYTLNEKSEPLFNKAESFFQSNPDSALIYYELALKADPKLILVMTYIGQIYEQKNNMVDAIEWYKKAISKNYIDYMAHWFLADAYDATGDLDKALDEIVIAQILNRNNVRIKSSLNRILKKVNKSTEDWYFNPQIEIKKNSDKSINVATDEIWAGYGLTKALWEFEPGYKESMGVKNNEHSTLEDEECLLALLTTLENKKSNIENDAQLRILKEAVNKKSVDEYIFYELFLPENPFIAYQLSQETILGIKDYILNIRNK